MLMMVILNVVVDDDDYDDGDDDQVDLFIFGYSDNVVNEILSPNWPKFLACIRSCSTLRLTRPRLPCQKQCKS
ncbi:hypothetical protein DERP_004863 [Dermatophagoides pteronyssinus]|uniref:Uncharacterized protein n=1 Tax=Dermatophagoides pteronyssinus TaxID=6956 RepID=A0ABQ8JSQ7_DERPT|nr:hypothetical protein DERP_004863 [Dermatophagoides pteronyssinus]